MSSFYEQIKRYTQQLAQQDLYRKRVIIDEKNEIDRINFCSNDYLSLSSDERVRKLFQQGFAQYPAGSKASALISGYHQIHRDLEKEFARVLQVDDAMIFSTGFAANLGIAAMLSRLQGHLIIDKEIHASFYDGILSSQAAFSRFKHCHYDDLAVKLQGAPNNPVIITEGIFSMSGQQACLDRIIALASSHRAPCIVDEAHSFGVLGEHGLGAVSQHGLDQSQIPLRTITFGKAFGAQGAIVVGQAEWIEALVQFSRSHTYSTAMSPAIAYGLLHILPLVYNADDRRKKLSQLIDYFRKKIQDSPLIWRNSHTAIQQLQLGCPKLAIACANHLTEQGIVCMAIREPTVNRPETGLRIVLNYCHEQEQIDRFFEQLDIFYESVMYPK